MGLKEEGGIAMPPMGDCEDMLVFCTEEEALGFLQDACRSISSPNNPYYDKEFAEKNAISLFINKRAATHALARMLWGKGYLPDAGMNSVEGYEYGRKFFADNADFLIDYFHHAYKKRLGGAGSTHIAKGSRMCGCPCVAVGLAHSGMRQRRGLIPNRSLESLNNV